MCYSSTKDECEGVEFVTKVNLRRTLAGERNFITPIVGTIDLMGLPQPDTGLFRFKRSKATDICQLICTSLNPYTNRNKEKFGSFFFPRFGL